MYSGINQYHYRDFFDESFADSYAAIVLLKEYGFSPEVIAFLKEIVTIRRSNTSSGFIEPHDTAESLAQLLELVKDKNFQENLVFNCTMAYEYATRIASEHIDKMLINKKFFTLWQENATPYQISSIANHIRRNQDSSLVEDDRTVIILNNQVIIR